MSENKELWNRVCKTNPDNTKHVNQRGGFTSIDAHSQIECATDAFGPVGKGWGYTVVHDVIETKIAVLAVADVTLWFEKREQSFGPWRGMAELVNAKGHVDDDAAKKATTDAITKALSHLGFNADVFLGKYDDNKYVAQLKQEFAGAGKAQNAEPFEDLQKLLTDKGYGVPAFVKWWNEQDAHKELKIKSLVDIPQGEWREYALDLVGEWPVKQQKKAA